MRMNRSNRKIWGIAIRSRPMAIWKLGPTEEVPGPILWKTMKKISCVIVVAFLVSPPTHAQSTGPITINSSDMFNQVGQYYKAYSNPYDLTGANSTNFVSPPPYTIPPNLIGSAGPNQLWDF